MAHQEERRRDAKNGVKHGPYQNQATFEARSRVVEAAMEGEDWKNVALANGIKIGTAYNWVRKMDPTLKVRGAKRNGSEF